MLQLKKTAVATAMAVSGLTLGAAHAAQVPYATFTGAGAVSNFTWLYADGFGTGANGNGFTYGVANNVTFTWDGTLFTSNADYTGPGGASNATISSPTNLFGLGWTTHDVQIFGPGTYSFDTAAGGNLNDYETGPLTMTVDPGQLGVHMLMNWNISNNIDIVNVWNLNSAFSNCGSSGDSAAENCLYTGGNNPAGNNANTVFLLASTDDDGDGTLGIPMITEGLYGGGPFAGHNFNFNLQGTMTVVPVPAAVWLFGSGLLGLLGMARRKKKS